MPALVLVGPNSAGKNTVISPFLRMRAASVR
jgi:hypothetical protein